MALGANENNDEEEEANTGYKRTKHTRNIVCELVNVKKNRDCLASRLSLITPTA